MRLTGSLSWDAARNWLIANGYARSTDFIDAGPSGNVILDTSRYDEIRDSITGGRSDAQLIRDALGRYFNN